ncbi:MAG: GerAB/ArcD/ProY family transporter [Clostridia bacterium]|nr:GerAB/ArcD/ProY family transporter [Clostridia bacterium]
MKAQIIGPKEVGALVLITIINRLAWIDPQTLLRHPGQNAWMLPILALPAAGLTLRAVRSLAFHYGGPINGLSTVLGRRTGAVYAVLIAVWLTLFQSAALARVVSVTRYYFFPRTDPAVITAYLMGTLTLISFSDAEGVARSARLMLGVPLVTLFGLLLLSFPSARLSQLAPLFGQGVGETLASGALFSGTFFGVYVLWLFGDCTGGAPAVSRAARRALLLGAGILTVSMAMMAATAGYGGFKDAVSYLYAMAANIDWGRYVQRLGPIHFFVWYITALLSGGMIQTGVARLLGRLLCLGDMRPMAALTGLCVYALTVLFTAGYAAPLSRAVNLMSTPVLVLLPAVPALIGRWKRRRADETA